MLKQVLNIVAPLSLLFAISVVFAVNTRAQPADDSVQPADIERGAGYVKERSRNTRIAGFPALPAFPGAVFLDSYKKTEGGRVGFEAKYSVDASVPEVIRFYEVELNNRGWRLESSGGAISRREHSLVARRGNIVAHVIAELEDGVTEVVIEIPMHGNTERQ
ncbi:MAG: hypothetical protein O7F71_13310 [Gammaproteobacteria bacterium]|nr:hypothetical protein [Gammaproteobacteria bacterium]